MDNVKSSPSPARWFRVLKRTVSGDCQQKKFVTPSLCEDALRKCREAFSSGKTRPCSFRSLQLEAILNMLDKHEEEFIGALEQDMHRPRFETILSEINSVKNEALYALNNLEKWTQPVPGQKSMSNLLDSCFIQMEPVGVVLIISGWSFPIQLSLIPLVGAVAAGNCVVLQPSGTCTHAANLLQRLIPLYLDNSCYHVACGGQNELMKLLENKFDHILYTGDRLTGRAVMLAAAKYITPVSLVLGGKNPCYVDNSCDINMAARRIAWARFVNAGQSSLAPDYILCQPEIRDTLIHELSICVEEFYGKNPRESSNYGRLASVELYLQVKDLLSCGQVAFGGETDDSERYIAPTVLTDVKEADPIMQTEILGPVLPILTVENLDEAIQMINRKDRPLAVYVYSESERVISDILCRTSSGSFCSNDSMIQSIYTSMPCGIIGNSGIGIYRGKHCFEAFSQSRACLLRNTAVECVTYLRYPPYAEKPLRLLLWACSISRKKSLCHIL
ncbi:aldehyde dehydrogenase 3 family member B1 [Xenopus tropicalis]|nr:aldehyde dehydrogenase 3 family member B1 [Xenopus tropicalis]AAI61161.1 aldh3b1 protein [Xenopus tropicalis]AAI70898.1 aldehyde dehydrogenase 3 family, member B1 [Xenopus tropicalis]AAI70900.1 aldehyde dehydrogenase 3 family, member B1 [Xenopus tropicalis]CAJ81831.1 novel aldehyde dehydrogenase 3 family member [Xenopus tropicalis]|eukprot:NP_001016129.1 aldehyde dehydrogenase 3 family member B1 [Xenopus tropicalis]